MTSAARSGVRVLAIPLESCSTRSLVAMSRLRIAEAPCGPILMPDNRLSCSVNPLTEPTTRVQQSPPLHSRRAVPAARTSLTAAGGDRRMLVAAAAASCTVLGRHTTSPSHLLSFSVQGEAHLRPAATRQFRRRILLPARDSMATSPGSLASRPLRLMPRLMTPSRRPIPGLFLRDRGLLDQPDKGKGKCSRPRSSTTNIRRT